MRTFFLTFLGVIAGFFFMFLLFVGAIALFVQQGNSAEKAAARADKVLTLDLRTSMSDQPVTSIFADSPAVIDLVQSLKRAETDDSVKGLFVRANTYGLPVAQAEEISLSLQSFKDSGKFVIVHAQGFEGVSLTSYMSVAPASEIWLQDTSTFSAAGFRAEIEFLGGVFDWLDAEPQFEKFSEYKNAVNTYTETELTPAHREAMTSLLNSLFDNTLARLDGARGQALAGGTWSEIFEGAPYSAEQAAELGLVDRLGHVIDAKDRARELADNDDIAFVDIFSGYGGTAYSRGTAIALVQGQGTILPGSGGSSNPLGGESFMGGDAISEAILEAAEADYIKAIIIRVDSPGGSAIASDQIWDAVERAKESGKPVVISMGGYAASGGYYVSANADHIVALPTTITGSIGVFGGKFVLDKTFDKVGYNIEGINVGGEYVEAYSVVEPFNQRNRAAFRNMMEDIYEDFTIRVSDGRDIPLERVQEIAKGRVWTGAQAREIGLVDELGGLTTAIDAARELAGIDEDDSIRLVNYPRKPDPFAQLVQMLNTSAEAGATLQELDALIKTPEFQALIEARAAAGQRGQSDLKARIPEFQ